MKRSLATVALMAALALTACSRGEAAGDEPAPAAAAGAAAVAPTPDAAGAGAAPATTPVATGVAGAPAFAALYPGAIVTQPATTARAPDGSPGGIVTFTTPDSPDAVIAFYRQRAEAAGLTQIGAMNRGEAKAYGAGKADGGPFLNVVADPVAAGETSVQLSWTSVQ
jgi:hypothetical protein